MPASVFLDTNVLIYVIAKDDARAEVAEALLAAGGVVSVQVCNEFAAAARRKLGMSWDDITETLDAVRVLCPSPRAMTIEMHDAAVRIARTLGFHFSDALVVASALAADCVGVATADGLRACRRVVGEPDSLRVACQPKLTLALFRRERRLVSQDFAIWNQMDELLWKLDLLRAVAWLASAGAGLQRGGPQLAGRQRGPTASRVAADPSDLVEPYVDRRATHFSVRRLAPTDSP